MRLLREHRLAAFYAMAFALSWAWWLPLVVSGEVIRPGAWPSHVPGLLGPALAAIIVTATVSGRPGLRELGRRFLRWRIGLVPLVVIVAPALLFVGAALVQRRLTGAWPSLGDLGRMNGFPIGSPILLWLLLVIASGAGEETGWRGYALERLRERHGLLASALLLAPVWAIWHVPMFALLEGYRGFTMLDLVGFFIGLTSGALVLAWLYERAGRSLVAVALWHGTFNLFTGSVGARGLPAAVVTTAVIAFAVVLAIGEVRHPRRQRPIARLDEGMVTS